MTSESTVIAAEKSTHDTPIFEFDFADVIRHPNADRLGCYTIPDSDYSYVLNLADWEGYKGPVCWVPPDSLVDVTREQFKFLADQAKYDGYARIKAKRLRGVVSYGLLVKSSDSASLGIKHYDPPGVSERSGGFKGPSAQAAKAPDGTYYKYDVDAFLKYGRQLFTPGELCYITTKYHGENFRAVYKDGVQHVGSRTEWKKEHIEPVVLTVDELVAKGVSVDRATEIVAAKVSSTQAPTLSHWWKGFYNTPGLQKLCEKCAGTCVYGEIIGTQGKFSYGLSPGEYQVRVFDILDSKGNWLPFHEVALLTSLYGVPMVQVIHRDWPFDYDAVKVLAESHTVAGVPCNEGIVIGPMTERYDARLGRVKLKCINPAYLELK